MNRLVLIVATSILILSIGVYVYTHKRDTGIIQTVLKPDVQEKIIVNPALHSLIIITDKGTEALSLPDRASSIEILKTGKLRLTVPQCGFEHSPFIGIGYSSQVNDYLGLDVFYWKRLDFGISFGFDRLKLQSLSAPLMISYTIWHNTRLTFGVEPFGKHEVHGLVSVRL